MNEGGEKLSKLEAALPRRPELDAIECRLLACEDAIRLLDRATPPALGPVIEAFVTGAEPLNEKRLPVTPLKAHELQDRELEAVADALERLSSCLRTELLKERTVELLSEHERALSLGTKHLPQLTREVLRPYEDLLTDADRLCGAWLTPDLPPHRDHTEGERGPLVLFEEWARLEVERRGLAVRVVPREMPSRAAVGPSTLFVQRRLSVRRLVAERILVHELEGHLLPRLASARAGAPFSIGPAGASLDEEGFALDRERRGNFLEFERRKEIGLRYRAARRVLDEVSPEEIVIELCDLGLSRAQSIRTWARAARGPALGRDLCYLIGYVRVSGALLDEPGLEPWFQLGRMSVPAAQKLERATSDFCGDFQASSLKSATTGV